MKRCIHIITLVITISTIICSLLVVIPKLFGYEQYIILSGSMEPMIPTGSVSIINRNDKDFNTNDIVAYQTETGVTIVHRIIGYDDINDKYILKGDMNDLPDASGVNKQQMIGTYVNHIPILGFILNSFEHPLLHVGSFAVPAPMLFLIAIIISLNLFDYLANEESDNN